MVGPALPAARLSVRRTATAADLVVDLRAPAAARAELTGAKAANLARAAARGLPVEEGFVLTTTALAAGGLDDPRVARAAYAAWAALSGPQGRPLVVRSSSTIEDASTSSMAGRFTSVLDVCGWEAFVRAVTDVVASGDSVRGASGVARPMAVLVQPQVDAVLGGVAFGVDPVTGDRRRVVIDSVAGRPDALVSGTVDACHEVVTRRGRLVARTAPEGAPRLSARQRRRVARLVRRAGRVLGGPQDIEWAIDRSGRLLLLQARPVTAVAPEGHGHLMGPGPVAETFPLPLRRLEVDLWLVPLRDGIVRALHATGAVSRRALRRSPVVTAIGGWAAVDLELLGVAPTRRRLLGALNPVPPARRLAAAWRVGRLRVALPDLAAGCVATVDAHLSAIPALDTLDEERLLTLLRQARRELATVHMLEVLAGMLLVDDPGIPEPLLALRALATGRAAGLDESEILVRMPEVLALVPPTLGPAAALPPTPPTLPAEPPDLAALPVRDALRLRTRWLQELTGRTVRVLAARLVAAEVIRDAADVRDLTLAELEHVVGGGFAPSDLAARREEPDGPPLPNAFRIARSGAVVGSAPPHGAAAGIPAGGGRGVGTVRHRADPTEAGPGTVLVVAHLEPRLAPIVPGLAGLVAETGSPLSHLAILAREAGVPTVVGVPDARRRFPPGTRLLVDGTTGAVDVVDGGAGEHRP